MDSKFLQDQHLTNYLLIVTLVQVLSVQSGIMCKWHNPNVACGSDQGVGTYWSFFGAFWRITLRGSVLMFQ